MIIGSFVAMVLLALAAVWGLPVLFTRGVDLSSPEGRRSAEAVNAARIPVGVLMAAVFAAAAASAGVIINSYSASLTRENMDRAEQQHRAKLEQDRAGAARTAELTQAGQCTDRCVRAIQLTSDDELDARLGGLYALEQLAREAPRTYRAAITDVLAAYIRDRAPWPPRPAGDGAAPAPRRPRSRVARGRREAVPAAPEPERSPSPAIDVETAPTILARQVPLTAADREGGIIDRAPDLRDSDLRGADLSGRTCRAHLQGGDLRDAEGDSSTISSPEAERPARWPTTPAQ